ncbi:MAG: UTP--glucose-1-phosphate uridylyltransferase [Clostridia bacterium]
MKITKAVIPAAGFGTRMLPFTKAVPKELIPIVDKPSIQYIVEEAVASGIDDILIILSRGKSAVEDHFDRHPELEDKLLSGNKAKELEEILKISNLANICFIRQKEIKGLGHAVYCTKNIIGNNPFAVLYGDDVIMGKTPATLELCNAYDKYDLGVAGIKEVSVEAIKKYSSMDLTKLEDKIFKIRDMIEKPTENQIMSLYSILGRVVLPSEIFDILENTKPGAGNEIQLTDAMKTLANKKGMIGVEFSGTRYDMGNKLGVMKASVETALNHSEIGDEFKAYLKELIKTI